MGDRPFFGAYSAGIFVYSFFIYNFASRNNNYQKRMNDFERLFNRLYPRVKLFAMQLLKHEDEAEDVAQNVFAKLWEMPEKWSEDNLDSYVFVMTRNHVLNVIRYRKIHEIGGVECDDNADATLPAELGADDPLYYEETLLLMRLTLDRMPERRRQIFELSRMQGLSNAEIAEQLQLSVRTVEHQIYLALKELKKTMLLFVLLAGI